MISGKEYTRRISKPLARQKVTAVAHRKKRRKKNQCPQNARNLTNVLGGEKWSAAVHFKSLFVGNLFEKYVTE